MPNNQKAVSTLVPLHEDYVGSTPFEPGLDIFGRKQLADRLTGYIDRLKDGCVFAIDAPWGDGKTWFAKNWCAQLKSEGYTSIYVDAFERDYIDDPFLLIFAELLEAVSGDHSDGLVEAGKRAGKALLPLTAKIAINAAGRLLIGTANIADDVKKISEDIDKEVSDSAKKFIEGRLSEYESAKQSIKHFREKMAELSSRQARPIVILIDELDRCRPVFAVQLIERIKHFFDVPHLVFVLFLNQKQLEASVRGVYGEDLDAHTYLRKFLQFTLTLPKQQSVDSGYRDFNRLFCKRLCYRFGLHDVQNAENFNEALSIFAPLLSLSLRDLERGYVLYSMAQPMRVSSEVLAYLVALKLAKPDLYRRLVNKEMKAHSEAVNLMSEWEVIVGDNHWLIPKLRILHESCLSSVNIESEELAECLGNYGGRFRTAEDLFQSLFKKIDLSIEG